MIEYTNKKIETFTKKTKEKFNRENELNGEKLSEKKKGSIPIDKYEKLYRHIYKKFDKIVEEGIVYSLFVISKLEQISGDWSQLKEG